MKIGGLSKTMWQFNFQYPGINKDLERDRKKVARILSVPLFSPFAFLSTGQGLSSCQTIIW